MQFVSGLQPKVTLSKSAHMTKATLRTGCKQSCHCGLRFRWRQTNQEIIKTHTSYKFMGLTLPTQGWRHKQRVKQSAHMAKATKTRWAAQIEVCMSHAPYKFMGLALCGERKPHHGKTCYSLSLIFIYLFSYINIYHLVLYFDYIHVIYYVY